jgi:hypothetical protein
MFLVGGLEYPIWQIGSVLAQNSNSSFVKSLIEMLGNAFVGIIAGGVILLIIISIQKITSKESATLH